MIWSVEPVRLECPCKEPLSIGKQANGTWVLGHFEEACSYLIISKDANKVLEKFLGLVEAGSLCPHSR